MIIFSTETPQTCHINNGCMFLFGTFTSEMICIAKYDVNISICANFWW